jgi:hypothetical protein
VAEWSLWSAIEARSPTATNSGQEIEKPAEELKTALMAAQAREQRLTAEIEAERRQHGATREQSNAVSTELMTAKARAEAQAGVELEQGECGSVQFGLDLLHFYRG